MKRIGIFLIVLLLLTANLIACQPTPKSPSVEPPAPTEEPPTEPSPIPTNPQENDKQETKILVQTDLGLILVRMGEKKHMAYGLGFILNLQIRPPSFEFPIYVSKSENGGPWETITTIPDPNIDQIGSEWETLVKNPDHPNHVIKIKLIRVEEEYKYRVKSYFSVDGGDSWWKPLIYPFGLMNSEEKTSLHDVREVFLFPDKNIFLFIQW